MKIVDHRTKSQTSDFDPAENIPYHNPYKARMWYDQIKDPTIPEGQPGHIIDVGTKFMARYQNTQEDGIEAAFERIVGAEKENRRLRSRLDLKDRTDSEYTFLDAFDGSEPTNMTLDTAKTVLTTGISTGVTKLPVLDATGFKQGTEITICSGDKQEAVKVIAVASKEITTTPTVNDYAKGALVARTNAIIDVENQQVIPGRAGTYEVSLSIRA